MVVGFFTLTANEKVLWLMGALKLVCPNVCRYELLMLSYLQKFNRFPSAETKVQKNYPCSITSVSPHLPQYYVGGSYFLSSKYSSVKCCLCFGFANLSALYSFELPFGTEREVHFSLHISFPINTICPTW